MLRAAKREISRERWFDNLLRNREVIIDRYRLCQAPFHASMNAVLRDGGSKSSTPRFERESVHHPRGKYSP